MKHELTPDSVVSVLAPIYNEAGSIDHFIHEVYETLQRLSLPCKFEMVLCDDGSHDGSGEILDAWAGKHPDQIRVIHLARNFGHSSALWACIEHARGDVVIIMDGDMQDDPAAFGQFLEKWREGYEVVYAIRTSREEHASLRLLFWIFYRLLNWMAWIDMPLDAGNFGLMDRCVVDQLRRMPERHLYLPGLRAWIGFSQAGVSVRRRARYDRKNRVGLRGLFRLAMNAIFSFSNVPLFSFRVASVVTMGLFALLVFSGIVRKIVWGIWFSSEASYLITVLFFVGLNLFGLAVVGEYLIRIYDEVKARPKYIVSRITGSSLPTSKKSPSQETE